MSEKPQDIICTQCAHVRLLNEIVRAFTLHNRAADLREFLAPVMAEAQRQGFGAEQQEDGK